MSSVPVIALAVLVLVYLPPAMVLAWVDARERRLPNRWVGGMSLAVTGALLLAALVAPQLRPGVRSGVVLAVVLGIGAVVLALFVPALLGMGDAKALPVVVLMSTALGGEVLIAALLAIALLGGIAGAGVMVISRRTGQRFAVGPVLLAGPFLGLLGAPLVGAALGTA